MKAAFDTLGLEVRRKVAVPAPSAKSIQRASAFHNALLVMLAERARHGQKVRIVQVGANDGLLHDPLRSFTEQFPSRTDVLLVEPQAALIPMLRQNYAFHPSHVVLNQAIGDRDSLVLFSVKEEIWNELDVRYEADWPSYRAPSGITSSSRAHVVKWLEQNARGLGDLDTAIRETVVPCSDLRNAIERSGFGLPIDVLQVDAEGFDDVVLQCSSIETFLPGILQFEGAHLGPSRRRAIVNHLERLGYSTSTQARDVLAVLLPR